MPLLPSLEEQQAAEEAVGTKETSCSGLLIDWMVHNVLEVPPQRLFLLTLRYLATPNVVSSTSCQHHLFLCSVVHITGLLCGLLEQVCAR